MFFGCCFFKGVCVERFGRLEVLYEELFLVLLLFGLEVSFIDFFFDMFNLNRN